MIECFSVWGISGRGIETSFYRYSIRSDAPSRIWLLRPEYRSSSSAKGWKRVQRFKLVRDQPWIKSLDLQFQYTYTSTENLTNNADTRLPKWPLNQWSAILSYQPIEALRANLEGRFVGQRFNDTSNVESLPHFYVWNASVHL